MIITTVERTVRLADMLLIDWDTITVISNIKKEIIQNCQMYRQTKDDSFFFENQRKIKLLKELEENL